MTAPRTPEDLFHRFRERGDTEALAAVFDALAPDLLLVAAHVAAVATDAEDLVQATFLDAIEKSARWDATRPLRPWLVGIMVNHARQLRRQRQRALDASRLPPQQARSPLDELAEQEVGERVAAGVRGLPRQYRHVLTLRLVHGLQPTAIAHALGCPVATVKTRLQRGMEFLRKALPAGIAASAALLLATGRGLAQVRAVVLLRAASLVPAATGSVVSLSLLGGLLVKKIALAVAAAAIALVAWIGLRPPPDLAPDSAPNALIAASAAIPELPHRAQDAVPHGGDATARRAVATEPTATTGALALEFVWEDDGSPAAHLHVNHVRDREAIGMWRTDSAGRLLRDNLAPGDYQVFGFAFSHRATVRAGDTTTGRIAVKVGLHVRGIVVDEQGLAVADAAIEAQYFPNRMDLEERTVAHSGRDGRFACRLDGEHFVWAHRRGLATSTAVCIHPPGNAELRLVLTAGAAVVRGRVRTAEGLPAGGAQLTIVRSAVRNVCGGPVRLCAASDGTFATDELGPGEHVLVARAADYADTALEFDVAAREPTLLDVQMQRGASLTGTVHRNGEPAALASIEVCPDWAGGIQFVEARRPIHLLATARTQSGPDGIYRVDHVPTGPVAVQCDIRDTADLVTRRVDLADGELARCDFAFDGGELRGRAVDRHGTALAGWRISATPIGGGRGMMASVDSDGRFALQLATTAHYRLVVFSPQQVGGPPWFELGDVTAGAGELLVQLPFAIDSDGGFVVTVLDAGGHAPEGASAVLFREGVTQGWACGLERREDGRYQSTRLPPGDYRSGAIRIPGSGNVAFERVAVPEHGAVDLGVVRLPASGTLELAFRTADRRTVVPTEVAVFDNAANGGREFERAADGALQSPARPAGAYRVRAWGEDMAPFEQQVAIVAGRVSRYELVVAAAARVRFTCAARVPAAGSAPGTMERLGLAIATAAGKSVGYRQLDLGADGASCTVGLPRGDYTWETTADTEAHARGTFRVDSDAAMDVAVTPPPRD